MAHGIENMFYVGEEPWHGLGKQLHQPPTSEEAIKEAGLDWSVSLKPIQIGDRTYPKFLAVQRDTDGEIYGIVKGKYTPLQNREAFSFFDPIVKEGLAVYHTAGSLMQGEKIWILAKLPGDMEVVGGDKINRFLLLSNAHNGRTGVNIQFTPIRVVCNNTLTMAESQKEKSRSIGVIHSTKVAKNLEEVRNIIDCANQTFEATLLQYKRLADNGVRNIEQYITRVFHPENTDIITPESDLPRTVQKVIDLFKTHPTNNIPGIGGSLWAAYNSVTQYVDHFSGRDNTRLDQAWFGNGKAQKIRAFNDALALVA